MESKNGTLYVVATPIGNLEDITLRALRILKEVAIIACEDTRVTKKLLTHYTIDTPVISFHQHSDDKKIALLMEKMHAGEDVAVVTDAGTPGVSDPGNMLVAAAVVEGFSVQPIPGASALAALISVAGIDMQKFIFLGFPPHKKGRETFFKEVAAVKNPVLYYESPHRVIKNLTLLKELAPTKSIILGRELTKLFEETVRGSFDEVLEYFASNPGKIKGEFVIIVY